MSISATLLKSIFSKSTPCFKKSGKASKTDSLTAVCVFEIVSVNAVDTAGYIALSYVKLLSGVLKINDKTIAATKPITPKIDVLQQQVIFASCTMTDDIKERFISTFAMPSKPYILWKLAFAKVFKDKGGFDIVIGKGCNTETANRNYALYAEIARSGVQ